MSGFFFLIFFKGLLAQGAVDLSQSLIQEDLPEKIIFNEFMYLTPKAGHKINLDAENHCGGGRVFSLDKEKMTCQSTQPGLQEIHIYICDEEETFCKNERYKVRVGSPKGLYNWLIYYKNKFFFFLG